MLRRLHANTAGAFFICIYIHMGRGLYLGSYSNIKAWLVGVVIIVVAIGTAFFRVRTCLGPNKLLGGYCYH